MPHRDHQAYLTDAGVFRADGGSTTTVSELLNYTRADNASSASY